MAKHKCNKCVWLHSFTDNNDRDIAICVFDQSENYLQEVGFDNEDCELDGLAEDWWQEDNKNG